MHWLLQMQTLLILYWLSRKLTITEAPLVSPTRTESPFEKTYRLIIVLVLFLAALIDANME